MTLAALDDLKRRLSGVATISRPGSIVRTRRRCAAT